MKRRHKNFIQLAILAALSLLVILSVFFREISWPETREDRVEISVLFREWESGIWTEVRRGMEKAAADCGAELRFLTPQEANSATEQQLLIEQELQNGADGLVVVPASPEVLENTAQIHRGVPRIAMESAPGGGSFPVVPDNPGIGKMLAEAAAEDFPGGGTALLVNPVPGSAGLWERLDAAGATLRERGISVLVCEGEQEWKERIGQADFCLLPDPALLHPMLDFCEEHQIQVPLYTAGYSKDVADGLENGQIAAAVVWSGYGEGYQAVRQAVLGKDAGPLEIPVILVRKEEMYEAENQKILFPIGN